MSYHYALRIQHCLLIIVFVVKLTRQRRSVHGLSASGADCNRLIAAPKSRQMPAAPLSPQFLPPLRDSCPGRSAPPLATRDALWVIGQFVHESLGHGHWRRQLWGTGTSVPSTSNCLIFLITSEPHKH